jgi:hypothetical protein
MSRPFPQIHSGAYGAYTKFGDQRLKSEMDHKGFVNLEVRCEQNRCAKYISCMSEEVRALERLLEKYEGLDWAIKERHEIMEELNCVMESNK